MAATWRLEVRLTDGGRELMRGLMKANGITIVELAKRCGGISHRSTIGHLLSGQRSGCSPELANLIEKELLREARGLPQMKLFEVRVSRVVQDSATAGTRRRAAA